MQHMRGFGKQKQQGLIANREAPICRLPTLAVVQVAQHTQLHLTESVDECTLGSHPALFAGRRNPPQDAEQWHFIYIYIYIPSAFTVANPHAKSSEQSFQRSRLVLSKLHVSYEQG